MTDIPLEFGEIRDRRAVATFFEDVAEQLAGDGPITVDIGGESIVMTLPDRLLFEVELEREDDGDLSFEIELAGDIDLPEPLSEADSGPTAAPEAERGVRSAPTSEAGSVSSSPSESLGRFEIFRDKRGEWRWRLVHRNGNIIATSGEGYSTRRNARKGLESVKQNAPGAQIFLVEHREIDDG